MRRYEVPKAFCFFHFEIMDSPLLDLIKELLTHILELRRESRLRKRRLPEPLSPLILDLSLVLGSLTGLAHDSLVDISFLGVLEGLVGLLDDVEGFGAAWVAALVRMDQSGDLKWSEQVGSLLVGISS